MIAEPDPSPGVSCPSSKMMEMLLTVLVGAIGGNAWAGLEGTQRSRLHPALEVVTVPELHPTKCVTLSSVTTLNRGAPPPQCEPVRMS